MARIRNKKTDKKAYDEFYKGTVSHLQEANSIDEYTAAYEDYRTRPFCSGGNNTKGYVLQQAIRRVQKATESSGREPHEVTVLDAGCGQGKLSVYLACQGYQVIGVDISKEGCVAAQQLASTIGVAEKCIFLTTSLDTMSVDDNSIDFIIGYGALHHFIKYDNVPSEFLRVMKNDAEGYFVDGFGENRAYRLFHDKEKMKRLGDVTLTKQMIMEYYKDFDVVLMPSDWFTMLDKLYMKILRGRLLGVIRQLSRVHFWLDRRISPSSRIALLLCGSVMTSIRKRPTEKGDDLTA